MKLEAKQRLEAARAEPKTLNLKITASGDAYETLVNLLHAIQYNCNVGHSVCLGAFFDGDGADTVTIEGLPDGNGREIAEALCSYGGNFIDMVGPNSGTSFNDTPGDDGTLVVTRKAVWPKQ